MLDTLKDMAKSKKFLAALIAVACWIGGKVGLDMNPAELTQAVAPLWIYIGAQGYADHGKEKAKVEAATKPDPEEVAPDQPS